MFNEVMNQLYSILHELQKGYDALPKTCVDDYQVEQKHEYRDKIVKQISVIETFQEYYHAKSGKNYIYMVPCTRKCRQCHAKRIADGGRNHMHPIEVDRPPPLDLNRYIKAAKMRDSANRLGISTITAQEANNMGERCEILNGRIIKHLKRQKQISTNRQYWDMFHHKKKNLIRAFITEREKVK